MKIKIYADGADLNQMIEQYQNNTVQGFTTNPSLMRQAGVTDYKSFALKAVENIPNLPISFEVFADDFETMRKEALTIATFGPNVYAKIPITNTQGISSLPLIKELSSQGVQLNVTAILTRDQVKKTVDALDESSKSIVSVFAGRVADTGEDPMALMIESAQLCHSQKNTELLWASSREVLNIIQAEQAGADIITCSKSVLDKIDMLGKNLEQVSLETVRMFYEDSQKLGFKIL